MAMQCSSLRLESQLGLVSAASLLLRLDIGRDSLSDWKPSRKCISVMLDLFTGKTIVLSPFDPSNRVLWSCMKEATK